MLEMELEGQRWHGPHCACHGYLGSFSYRVKVSCFHWFPISTLCLIHWATCTQHSQHDYSKVHLVYLYISAYVPYSLLCWRKLRVQTSWTRIVQFEYHQSFNYCHNLLVCIYMLSIKGSLQRNNAGHLQGGKHTWCLESYACLHCRLKAEEEPRLLRHEWLQNAKAYMAKNISYPIVMIISAD